MEKIKTRRRHSKASTRNGKLFLLLAQPTHRESPHDWRDTLCETFISSSLAVWNDWDETRRARNGDIKIRVRIEEVIVALSFLLSKLKRDQWIVVELDERKFFSFSSQLFCFSFNLSSHSIFTTRLRDEYKSFTAPMSSSKRTKVDLLSSWRE